MTTLTDIANHWTKPCILALVERSLVNGYPDGTYKPDGTVSRAEYATLLFRVFPDAPQVREPLSFTDVPTTFWAHKEVLWAYQRGFFSGYPDNTFRPDQILPRAQAIAVLATAKRLAFPTISEETLAQYYDDVAEIPDYAKGAIAAATLKGLVVNYPEVRQLRPAASVTRGEVAALLCQALDLRLLDPKYVPWSLGLADIKGSVVVAIAQLKANGRLVKELQLRLSELGLYPGGRWIDGRYGPQLEAALKEFCTMANLPNMQSGVLDSKFAQQLLTINAAEIALQRAKDRQRVFTGLLKQEVGASASHLAFLDRGYKSSIYQAEIPQFPDRLRILPDNVEVKSLGTTATSAEGKVVTFAAYPKLGELPQMDTNGLSFLHGDIPQACICIGSLVDNKLQARWFGRNPLQNIELWSTTKIIPLLNVVSRLNANDPKTDVDNCLIRPRGSSGGYAFYDLAVDLVSYKTTIGTSNAIAAMFKQFSSAEGLDGWLKQLTGNRNAWFRGRYGEPPFIQSPEVCDKVSRKVLLSPAGADHNAGNTISVYDLTRLISMLAWHHYLPADCRIPHAQWDSLECIVRAMGTDSARYLDVAIAQLGLEKSIKSPVLISKLGFGRSSVRDRTELAYTAVFQFIDRRPKLQNQPAILRQVALTLIAAKDYNDSNKEAIEMDARMAAEITEIIRRIVLQELV
jgi:peptidoglycan hydrolase-like protein with peptidoglycan-binding domain